MQKTKTKAPSRLKEVYIYLRRGGRVRNQKQFAASLGKAEATISRAINGDPRAMTKKLAADVCIVYPDISIDWLVSGKGEMTRNKAPQPTFKPQGGKLPTEGVKSPQKPANGPVGAIVGLYSGLVEDMQAELARMQEARRELEAARVEMQAAIDEQRNATAALRIALVRVLGSSDATLGGGQPEYEKI